MRNIRYVIEQIVQATPKNQENFIKRLYKISADSMCQAPESTAYWEKLQECLWEYIGYIPRKEWEWEVCSIMTTMSVEELEAILCSDAE